MRKEAEQYIAEELRRLQDKRGKAKPPKVLEAEKIIAEFREEESNDAAIMARAQLPHPSADVCPDCFIKNGTSIQLHPISAEDDSDVDLFKCSRCGLILETKP